MKISVINGTELRGCTYHIKEAFLAPLRSGNDIKEYYLPGDMPHFCCGCKRCFFKHEIKCPHAEHTMPIWNDILAANLLVFATPVYVLRAPGQMKALLDHFGCHWMVHRPKAEMQGKRAVILTNSIGAPNGTAQKDIATSLTWLGVSHIRKLGFGLMEGVIWHELSRKRREKIERKTKKLALKYKKSPQVRRNIKVRLFWTVCKTMHQAFLKKEEVPSADNQYWLDQGWIRAKGK